MRFKLTIAYDGTEFHGWQKQEPPGLEPLRTVAGVIEDVLRRTLGQPIILSGASRTDAGVHALGQVGQFDAESRIPVERMAEAITSRLPRDIEVRSAEVVSPDFNAITQAISKQYRYRIWNTPLRPLTLRHVVNHCPHPLDVARMRDAGRRLVGTHDFAGFAAAHHGRISTVRTIHRCDVEVCEPEIRLIVEGNGFLYNMVRIIAGTLIDVGRGRLEPAVVDEAIRTGNRRLVGPTMPPGGLCLQWIRYGDP